jgi:hypothetical protein
MKKGKEIEQNYQELFNFKKLKRKMLIISIFFILATIIPLAIVGFKIFYPFHVVIGFSLYILSFIPIIRRIYISKKTWKKYRAYKFSESFFRKEKKRLIFLIIFIIGSICFLWLRPIDENPFSHYSDEEIKNLVIDDLYKSVTAMDYLETTGNILLEKLDSNNPDAIGISEITPAFTEFIKAVSYSEFLTDTHRYFSYIPYRLKNERISSFLISYSLYIKKYEIVHRIMKDVSGDSFKKKILNQYIEEAGKSDVYSEMSTRFFEPKTRLRLTGGYYYMKFFDRSGLVSNDSYDLLFGKSSQSYDYLRKNFFGTILRSGEVLVDFAESKMFDTWFPIQKNIAIGMGRIILTTRGKDGLITKDQAIEMGKYMEPGDIMLQRRNWHLSNVGIPGFWTHATLYTGDLDTMNNYFSTEFPFDGYRDFLSYIMDKKPNVYEKYKEKDLLGYNKSVMEAIEPGVILQSLPKSAGADFVAVLRPRLLTKKDKMLAIIRSFDHVGKPYDFDFDFDTLDALVCSELVYDSYFENISKGKGGLHFETSLVNGRIIVIPLDIAKKFKSEYGNDSAELELIYFLEGNEKMGMAKVGTIDRFIQSIDWSKFSFLQNK